MNRVILAATLLFAGSLHAQAFRANKPATGGSGGIGDVVGPASSVDNRVVRWDGTTGKLIQNSVVTIDDTGHVTPVTNDAQDLGSNTLRWQDIYLGPATIHIGTATGDEGTITYDTTANTLDIAGTGSVLIHGGAASTGCTITTAGNLSCTGTIAGGGGTGIAFVQGGNSFGTTGTLGTNDAQNLVFETFNQSWLTLGQTGHLVPTSDNGQDLGHDGFRYRNVFAGPNGLSMGVSGNEGNVTFDTVQSQVHIRPFLFVEGSEQVEEGNLVVNQNTVPATIEAAGINGETYVRSKSGHVTTQITADDVTGNSTLALESFGAGDSYITALVGGTDLIVDVTENANVIVNTSGTTGSFNVVGTHIALGGVAYVVPPDDGTSGQFLQTNGTGTLIWATASGGGGTIGGSLANTQLCVGNGTDACSGSSALTYSGTTLTLAPATHTGDTLIVTGGAMATGKAAFLATGTHNASPSGDRSMFTITATGAGSGAASEYGINNTLAAGYTGTSGSYALWSGNASTATNTTSTLDIFADNGGDFNGALVGYTAGSTTGNNVGVTGFGALGALTIGVRGSAGGATGTRANSTNYGVFGAATVAKNGGSTTEKHIGVLGVALNGDTNVGGYFGLQGAAPTFATAALIADNGAVAAPIFVGRDNGTVAFNVADGGSTTITPVGNTAALTLTGTNVTTANNLVVSTLNTTASTGIVNISYPSGATQVGAIQGLFMDLATNVTRAASQSFIGQNIQMAGYAATATSQDATGLKIDLGTATQATSGTSNVRGINLQLPSITQSAGTVTSVGVRVLGGNITTGGTHTGFFYDNSNTLGAGTQVAFDVDQITGGAASEIAFRVGSGWDQDFSFTGGGTIGSTTTLTPATNVDGLELIGTNVTSALLLDAQTKNTTATAGILSLTYPSATTQGSGAIIGELLDLQTNLTRLAGQNLTGEKIMLAGGTLAAASHTTTGLSITGAAFTQQTSGAHTWNGVNVAIPAGTQTAGSADAVAFAASNAAMVTGGTSYGFDFNPTNQTVGTERAINIQAISTPGASATEQAIFVGARWDAVLDSTANTTTATTNTYLRLAANAAAAVNTKPTCTSNSNIGRVVVLEDTDDGAAGDVCVCINSDDSTYSWVSLINVTQATGLAVACSE